MLSYKTSDNVYRMGGAEEIRVVLKGQAGHSERVVNVRYVPTTSWLQNLCLTPAFADQHKTFIEHANDSWKVHVMGAAQNRCVTTTDIS